MTLPDRTRLLLLAACLLPAALLPAAFAADPAVSALVQTAPLQGGELLHTLRAYAVVQVPASQIQALTFQHPMQVQSLAVHAGQAVRKGQWLATLHADASSTLAYTQAQTAVSFAQGELDRMTALKAQQLATQAQVDAADKALSDAQAQLRSLQQQGAGQAQTRVVAPLDGIVLAVSAAPGDLLAAGSPLLQLGRAGSLQALAGVPPEDATRLQPGQPAQLTAVFDPAQHWQGSIRSVGAAINPKTQRLDVQIALPAQASLPAAGTSVQADMVLGRWRGWVVPRDAVLQDGRGAYVFQDAQGKARRVPVQIAIESGLQTGITGALDPKLPLVVAGNYELRDGMALRVAGARACSRDLCTRVASRRGWMQGGGPGQGWSPCPGLTTPQTPRLEATLRAGGLGGALPRCSPLVVQHTTARPAPRIASAQTPGAGAQIALTGPNR